MKARLRHEDPDLAILTEARRGLSPDGGHLIESEADAGFGEKPDQRKVVLWSRQPWSDVDSIGDPDLPGGRFVAGTTATPLGDLRVVGVCVPWRFAHVNVGHRDRTIWEDHLSYLGAVPLVLGAQPGELPLVVAGDFNQRIPRAHTPDPVADALEVALRGLTVHTDGGIDGIPRPDVDHLATRGPVRAERVHGWPGKDDVGVLSDHAGVAVDLCLDVTSRHPSWTRGRPESSRSESGSQLSATRRRERAIGG